MLHTLSLGTCLWLWSAGLILPTLQLYSGTHTALLQLPHSPLLPVQHWALGRYKQAATVMDKKITVSVRVDYSFFSPDRKEMSLHTSLGLLRAAPTSIRHCWSPSTPQPEMHLVGNASTWAEPFKGDQS